MLAPMGVLAFYLCTFEGVAHPHIETSEIFRSIWKERGESKEKIIPLILAITLAQLPLRPKRKSSIIIKKKSEANNFFAYVSQVTFKQLLRSF